MRSESRVTRALPSLGLSLSLPLSPSPPLYIPIRLLDAPPLKLPVITVISPINRLARASPLLAPERARGRVCRPAILRPRAARVYTVKTSGVVETSEH